MPKFQHISFQTIDEFLHYLPDEEYQIVEALRKLVLDCIPDVQEKLAYNVPFYYRFSRICYIWPAAVPWGNVKKEGVELGFCKGYQLSDPSYLHKGNRKEVYTKTFYSVKEIEKETVRQLLFEAVYIDEENRSLKKPYQNR